MGLTMSFDRVVHASLTIEQIHSLCLAVGLTSLLLMLPFMGGLALVGIAGSLVQTGLLWKPSLPFDIGPVESDQGSGPPVSLRSVSELIKALIKIAHHRWHRRVRSRTGTSPSSGARAL